MPMMTYLASQEDWNLDKLDQSWEWVVIVIFAIAIFALVYVVWDCVKHEK